ncbi:hypothetical protein NQ317_010561 [Molorchus minor]|uniref:ADF-H domain-containing protein n=1 Tax=Molorchus minor TaxID=1323400 RepID=A0ABQ9JA99_9CUCU|nr:hypothetical protein NQ317_010561 [Molorchus minor]
MNGKLDVEVIGARDEEYDSFAKFYKRAERANAATASTTLSICTSARAHRNLPETEALPYSWCPDTAKVKKKMLYSSNQERWKVG